jgi:hypothetical protein
MLVFLATRHSLSLTVWQEVARPRVAADGAESVAVARPGRGSLVVLFLFTLLVLGATALISPYLFRTKEDPNAKEGDKSSQTDPKEAKQGEGKDGKDGKDGKQGKDGKKKKKKAKRSGQRGFGGSSSGGEGQGQGQGDGDGDGDDGEDDDDTLGDNEAASRAARDAMELGLRLLAWLLVIAIALLILFLILFPPLRRVFLLRHLEKPLWPVSPTARVMNLWRRVVAELRVEGIEPNAGETPKDFARRAEQELQTTLGCAAPGLREAAAIVEKIDYAGRGLGAGEEQTMREAITTFLRTVSPRIGVGKKIASGWSRAPEVEA